MSTRAAAAIKVGDRVYLSDTWDTVRAVIVMGEARRIQLSSGAIVTKAATSRVEVA